MPGYKIYFYQKGGCPRNNFACPGGGRPIFGSTPPIQIRAWVTNTKCNELTLELWFGYLWFWLTWHFTDPWVHHVLHCKRTEVVSMLNSLKKPTLGKISDVRTGSCNVTMSQIQQTYLEPCSHFLTQIVKHNLEPLLILPGHRTNFPYLHARLATPC